MTSSGLSEYHQKRDLEKSGEPEAGKADLTGPLTFVVQKHRARHLHYDLRLELDGVLKSWAVPKGPSADPTQKRLATVVEDHPLEYAYFEGVIPKGEYGAGEVIVWDNGTYSPDTEGKYYFEDRQKAQAEISKGIKEGKLSVFFRGRKMKGSWTLVKVRSREKDWLLIKHRDEYAGDDHDILDAGHSVLSGRTIEDIKEGNATKSIGELPPNPAEIQGARQSDFPGFISPMLASLTDAPFSNPEWAFEPKIDGYRVIADLQAGKATLWSRRGNKVTERYPFLVPLMQNQAVSSLVLDGEVVAIDKNGHISFECLQQHLNANIQTEECRDAPLIYYVFDILYLDGLDLRGVEYQKRRQILQSVLSVSDRLRLVETFKDDGKTVFEAAIKNQLEGVVAKKLSSPYQSGRRSSYWLKVKAVKSDDFVIAGYTAGEGNRAQSMGALLLGYRDKNGKLIYAGHVGSGFNEQTLSDTKRLLDGLRIDKCPFTEVPVTNTKATWVRPELVAEVKYSQWTRDGRLRAPVFLRLREDKPESEARPIKSVGPPELPASARSNEVAQKILEQLREGKEKLTIKIEEHGIAISNLDKVFWPATDEHRALTKRDFLSYLITVSPFLLPHLKDRPITLSRYPDGVTAEHFWQRHWNDTMPGYIDTVQVSEDNGTPGEYLICNNFPTLIWLGQAADIELHTWFSRTTPAPDMKKAKASADHILNYPDFIIFDLDPYIYSGREAAGDEPELNRNAFDKACEVAVKLKEILDSLSLAAFIKTSGKTGLHIYVPIVRDLSYREVRKAAETIGKFVLHANPKDVTMEWSVEKRTGKVFIDYAQNVRGKTLASVYSPRPGLEAGVSFPLHWEQLGKVYPTDYTILTVPGLLSERGDIWAGIIEAKRSIKEILGQLESG